MEKDKKEEREEETEYIGNIWGWKFSFISLGIILFFVALMAYRHLTLPDEKAPKTEAVKTLQDTLDRPQSDH